ncbi:Uncharacterised protein [Candidatus Burarchaeum australiense]|nr:Uncharacterised protein [Candidatus Burarchaeum australiense]
MPSFSTCVAFFVPTMHGMPISRETIAACAVMPPEFVMMPTAFFIAGTKSGVVISVTRIAPFSIFSISLDETIILTGPLAVPGEAARPLVSTFAPDIPLTPAPAFSFFFPPVPCAAITAALAAPFGDMDAEAGAFAAPPAVLAAGAAAPAGAACGMLALPSLIFKVVIGLLCTMYVMPLAIAHSMSCGNL